MMKRFIHRVGCLLVILAVLCDANILHFEQRDGLNIFGSWPFNWLEKERSTSASPTNLASVSDGIMSLNIIQYNIFGRPYVVSYDGQQERMERIPGAIQAHAEANGIEIDVVTMAEADIAGAREKMLEDFSQVGFNYSTSILADEDPLTSLENGGVIIISRWPIVREAQHVYRNACAYADCLAAKGVKYARVVKSDEDMNEKVFNIFATHMQAWPTVKSRSIRQRQAQQFSDFMMALNISSEEPVLMAGDFNTDNITFPDEVSELLDTLEANSPVFVGSQLYTSDPQTNLLVGRDGAAKVGNCETEYEASWGPLVNGTYIPSNHTEVLCNATANLSLRCSEASRDHVDRTDNEALCVFENRSRYVSEDSIVWFGSSDRGRGLDFLGASNTYLRGVSRQLESEYSLRRVSVTDFKGGEEGMCFCPCCRKEWLDFVLYAAEPYQQPVQVPTLEAVRLKAETSFGVPWGSNILEPWQRKRLKLEDLSDHYPVLAKFVFPLSPQGTKHIDGCSRTSDCHLEWFRCYCEGEGCYYHGQPLNGRNLSSTHPVNERCIFAYDQCVCGPR